MRAKNHAMWLLPGSQKRLRRRHTNASAKVIRPEIVRNERTPSDGVGISDCLKTNEQTVRGAIISKAVEFSGREDLGRKRRGTSRAASINFEMMRSFRLLLWSDDRAISN